MAEERNKISFLKKVKKLFIFLIFLMFVLEVSSRVIVFFYIKKHVPEEFLVKIFHKSNFLIIAGGILDSANFTLDPVTILKLTPPNNGINEDCYRGKRVSVEKPLDTVRILCLGDSSTFGFGVDTEDSYPYFLERKLQNYYKDIKIEVINAGMPSGHSLEAKRIFQTKFIKYNPDLIIWRLNFLLSDAIELPHIDNIYILKYMVKRFIARSTLLHLIFIPIKPGRYFEDMTNPKKLKLPPYLKEVYKIRSDYDIVKYFAQSIKAKTIILDYVVLNKWGEYSLTHNIDERIAEGEYVISTLEEFKKLKDDPRDILFDSNHLSSKGNNFLSELVAEYIIENNLVK